MILLLASLAQVAHTAPQVPKIYIPTPISSADERLMSRSQMPRPAYIIDIDASANGQRLWQGSLRFGARGASFDRDLVQALPTGCADPDRFSQQSQRDHFRITVSPSGDSDGVFRPSILVAWQRPTDDCASAMLSRSVEIAGSVALAPNTPVTLKGDGGLVVRLVRR